MLYCMHKSIISVIVMYEFRFCTKLNCYNSYVISFVGELPYFGGLVHWALLLGTRDVYRIESIVSYQYHKTDTGIVSKWQINNTFNDSFCDDINKDRASLTQKWMFLFLLNACFVFHFYIIWKYYGPWILLYCMPSIPKGQKEKVNFLMVWYRIVWFRIGIGIVLSVSVLYRIVKK